MLAQRLMNRTSRDAPFLEPPNDHEVKAFQKYKTGAPTQENFRVDVRGRGKHSLWNKCCAKIFAEFYMESPDALTGDLTVVEEAFLSHISALSEQYKKQNGQTKPPDRKKAQRACRKRVSALYLSCRISNDTY